MPFDPEMLYSHLRRNPPDALRDIGETLGASEEWFYSDGQVINAIGDRLKLIQTEEDWIAVINDQIIPMREPRAGIIGVDQLRRFGVPTMIRGYFNRHAATVLPELKHVVRLPAVKIVNGKLVQAAPGYDATTGTFYVGSGIDTSRASGDYPHVKEWLSGLIFASPVHYANALGVMGAIIARSVIDAFPLLFIDSNTQSSGKSSLGYAMGYILENRKPGTVTYTGDEHRLESSLSGFVLRPGPNYIMFDNIKRKAGMGAVKSMVLARSISTRRLTIRPLYKSNVPIYDAVFMLNMNQGSVEADLSDKLAPIRLLRPVGTMNRKLDPHPELYAERHRNDLLVEYMSILEGVEVDKMTYDSRFYVFNQIVYGVAKKLGMRASFDPQDIAIPAAILRELVFYSEGKGSEIEPDKPFSLQRVVDKVAARPADYKELNRFLDGCEEPSDVRGRVLGYHLAHNFTGRPFLVREDRFVVNISEDYQTATLQKISPSA